MRTPQVTPPKARVEEKARDGLEKETPVIVPEEVQIHPVGDDDLPAYGDLEVQLPGGTLRSGKPYVLYHFAQTSEGQFTVSERRHVVSWISNNVFSTSPVVMVGGWQGICGCIPSPQHIS